MPDGIYTALSSAMADAKRIELISHNLANISTAGFKQLRAPLHSTQGAARAKELTFVQMGPVDIDNSGGPLRSTDNPLDIALTDGVYLAVEESGRETYLHGGTLTMRPDGALVTEEGHHVLGKEKAIRLDPGTREVTVAADGTVEADGNRVDRLRLVEFNDTAALEKGPGQTMADRGGAGPILTSSARPVMAGYREEANINTIRGMTELITAHRSYEAALRALQTHGQIEKRAANDIAGRI